MIPRVTRSYLPLVTALALVVLLAPPGLASLSTADLTAGPPPSGDWQVSSSQTGSLTAADVYGTSASNVSGFGDAYRRVWNGTNGVLIDKLERYTSVFWAAFRYGESAGLASGSRNHASYKKIPAFSSMAYETTDAADAQGLLADTVVFTSGDYLAVVELDAKGSIPHDVVMEQAVRQLGLLPPATAEYRSLGLGIILGGVGLLVVLAALVAGIVLLTRRRRPPVVAFAGMPGSPAPGMQLSPDRRHWWDGQAWQDAALSIPPGAARSPDGSSWWDGAQWRPAPPGWRP